MKVPYSSDPFIQVFSEQVDADDAEASLYEGIYSMYLNGVVRISFVPAVSSGGSAYGSAESSAPQSMDDARRIVLETSYYAVTPSSSAAGTEKEVRLPRLSYPGTANGLPESDADPVGVVWYVDPSDWSEFELALQRIYDRTGIRLLVKQSELGEPIIEEFLSRRFLSSPNLFACDLPVLGRGDR